MTKNPETARLTKEIQKASDDSLQRILNMIHSEFARRKLPFVFSKSKGEA